MLNPGSIYLIHWDKDERTQRAKQLSELGFNVECALHPGPELLRTLEAVRPKALIIDLTRIPSQGRDLGIAVRKRKGTRNIPLIFVGGKAEKVAVVQKLLPDAFFIDWKGVGAQVVHAIENPPAEVHVPDSVFEAYAGKPLATKLGIVEGARVLLVEEPESFKDILGDLPPGVQLLPPSAKEADLAIWFIRFLADLERQIDRIAAASQSSPVWIAWPKSKSKLASDVKQPLVRKLCMEAGMVDYKVCSIDPTWTALLFTWRGR
jgi:CheY-like chemotaxis protein